MRFCSNLAAVAHTKRLEYRFPNHSPQGVSAKRELSMGNVLLFDLCHVFQLKIYASRFLALFWCASFLPPPGNEGISEAEITSVDRCFLAFSFG